MSHSLVDLGRSNKKSRLKVSSSKYPDDTVKEVLRLADDGVIHHEISRMMDIPYGTISTWIQNNKLKIRN